MELSHKMVQIHCHKRSALMNVRGKGDKPGMRLRLLNKGRQEIRSVANRGDATLNKENVNPADNSDRFHTNETYYPGDVDNESIPTEFPGYSVPGDTCNNDITTMSNISPDPILENLDGETPTSLYTERERPKGRYAAETAEQREARNKKCRESYARKKGQPTPLPVNAKDSNSMLNKEIVSPDDNSDWFHTNKSYQPHDIDYDSISIKRSGDCAPGDAGNNDITAVYNVSPVHSPGEMHIHEASDVMMAPLCTPDTVKTAHNLDGVTPTSVYNERERPKGRYATESIEQREARNKKRLESYARKKGQPTPLPVNAKGLVVYLGSIQAYGFYSGVAMAEFVGWIVIGLAVKLP